MYNLNLYNLQLVKEKTFKYAVELKQIVCVENAVDILNNGINLSMKSEEYLYMICLNTKNKVLGIFEVSHGSLNSSVVHPREVFKRAVMLNSANIIIAHNHPSGDTDPSKEDIAITCRLKECGKILGIKLLDHIIVGGDNYISLKEKGII